MIYRYRYWLFAAWLLHCFLWHYFVLGINTWDAFGYRGFPIVELAQHGALNFDHFQDWSLQGYTPILELANLPFVWALGLKGFLFGFPLVVLPLCTLAVGKLVEKLTGDARAALWAALAYALIPMFNGGAFSAYIDFAVAGTFAYFLYALACIDRRAIPRLILATALFTLARAQAIYIAMVVVPLYGYALCGKPFDRRRALTIVGCVVVGALPEIAVQLLRWRDLGSPIAPTELKLLGVTIGHGISRNDYFTFTGLGGDDWGSVMTGALHGWLFYPSWPPGFFGSVGWAAGLIPHLAIAVAPLAIPRTTRQERYLVAAIAVASFMARDFAVPRYAYGVSILLCLVVGRGMSVLAERRRWPYWLAVGVLALHLLRPELDFYLVERAQWIGPRLDVTGSRFYAPENDIPPFPDRHYKLVIVDNAANNFVLHLYGRRITNEIVGIIWKKDFSCAALAKFPRDALFVDDQDLTKDCPRTCVLSGTPCRAYRIDRR